MKPLISFIITYHNEPEAWLQECIESIQALSLSPEEAEIIVVDDGSDVLPTFAGREGIRFVRQEQAGLSVARNTGLGYTQGAYVQFVDADDSLIPFAYEAVIKQLRKEEADVVMFRMTKQPPLRSPFGGVPQRAVQSSIKSTPPKGERGGGFFLQHRNLRAAAWGYAFKREILGDLRFCPGLLHEDELFTPQLFLKARSLVELDTKAYFYRQHEGTITHTKSLDKVQKRLDDIHFILRELQSLCNPLLERRVRQLTVDYIQKTWTLTHSFRELRKRKKELRAEGFLPLPLKCYSLRYFLYSLVV